MLVVFTKYLPQQKLNPMVQDMTVYDKESYTVISCLNKIATMVITE